MLLLWEHPHSLCYLLRWVAFYLDERRVFFAKKSEGAELLIAG